jgi:hypothetical protein
MKILNLTQHDASKEQLDEGVVNLETNTYLKDLLTVKYGDNLQDKATKIAALSVGFKYVMIGGAPFLMPLLENELKERGIIPVYAFSDRVVIEKDGVKTSMFQHKGWVVDGQFKKEIR